MISSTFVRLLPALVACAVVPGCRHKPTDMPVCTAYVTAEQADEADTRVLPPDVWFELLVMGIHRPALTVPDEPRECSGKAVEATPVRPDVAALPRRALAEADLTFAEAPDNQMLVWARLDHFDDGSARGPVALVRWVDQGVEVRGIGTLWAPARRPRLRLEPFGEKDALLIADGERCAKQDDPQTCTREMHLLPLIDQRFVQVPMYEDGADVGPAHVTRVERSDVALPDGWIRRADIQRHLRVRGDEITISESIRVRECDPASDPELCQERRATREERLLVWQDNRFSTTRSAWDQMARP